MATSGDRGGVSIGIAFACLVALAAAGYVGSVVGPHFKAAATSKHDDHFDTAAASSPTSTLAHASVKVLVANGTQQANTAGHFAQQLQLQGWNVANPRTFHLAGGNDSGLLRRVLAAVGEADRIRARGAGDRGPAVDHIRPGGQHHRGITSSSSSGPTWPAAASRPPPLRPAQLRRPEPP